MRRLRHLKNVLHQILVYGDAIKLPISEDHILGPISAYGIIRYLEYNTCHHKGIYRKLKAIVLTLTNAH
jgi:UDP-glucose 4-epimerase